MLADQSWERLNINGLGDVGVTARVQRLLLVPFHCECGDRDYRNVHGFRIGLQSAGHLKAVHAGQTDVGQDQARVDHPSQFERVFCRRCGVNLETLFGQENAHQLKVVWHVVNDEDRTESQIETGRSSPQLVKLAASLIWR